MDPELISAVLGHEVVDIAGDLFEFQVFWSDKSEYPKQILVKSIEWKEFPKFIFWEDIYYKLKYTNEIGTYQKVYPV